METVQNKSDAVAKLNRAIFPVIKTFRPPEDLTVSQWADKHRRLSPEASAEAGPWRTSRTPYLKDVMDAFTDPKTRRIVMVSASQVGKSELELNIIGYIMDQDPGSILYVHPTIDDAKKFSRLRVTPMIRDCPTLKRKIPEAKGGRDNAQTILQKSFPGGMLTITGSNVASALASTPVRYIIGDERDRWALSAGNEGDPWQLAQARQATFYNAKAVEVSTPTIKGASNIASSFEEGTQERWCHQCPGCGEYFEITFSDIQFDPVDTEVNGRTVKVVNGEVTVACPHCAEEFSEEVMRKQPQKWIADNPMAYELRGIRSFWLNAFSSPWMPWKEIITRFLAAKDNPQQLKVVFNTLFGQLWEDRGDLETEDGLLARREDYGSFPDGSPVELPDGVLVLTCGVDTQKDRIEYEVVGHGKFGETWGIEKGIIYGRPDDDDVWQRLDEVIAQPRRYADGMALKVSMTCVDSGGLYTQEVYAACRARQNHRVFAIKGKGGESVPFISVPTHIPVQDKRFKVWLYTIGVDAGKAAIMDNLKVQTPGPRYCHFPRNPDAGYDLNYFNGLLSEHLVLSQTSRVNRWVWEKLPGHARNEPLDCRNYALAAVKILNPPWDQLARRRKEGPKKQARAAKRRKPAQNRREQLFDSW